MSSWQSCTATTGNNYPCAAGNGNATSKLLQAQKQPSLDGMAAEFSIGGSTGYSNVLWWREFGNHPGPTHFTYDFWVLLPDPKAAQALEFDVNQSFNGTRYVFATECNLNGTGRWDVWDSSGKWGHWVPSNLGCPRVAANTWAHFVWQFEHSATQVHYISLTVNGTEYPVDIWTAAQSGWTSDDFNVAVQLDGDFRQDPYSLFVDRMSLTYW